LLLAGPCLLLMGTPIGSNPDYQEYMSVFKMETRYEGKAMGLYDIKSMDIRK
jgi:hypothetical protein